MFTQTIAENALQVGSIWFFLGMLFTIFFVDVKHKLGPVVAFVLWLLPAVGFLFLGALAYVFK
jgi:hypothetical protein